MDPSKLKRVGSTSDGEPIYELKTVSDLNRFQHSCEDPDCLACVFNKLIDPAEELEVWMCRAHDRLRELHHLPNAEQRSVRYERQMLRRKFALASETASNLKAMILTAAKIFEQI